MKPEEPIRQPQCESMDNKQLESPVQQVQALDFRDGVYKPNQTFEALLDAYAQDPERWDGLE